MTKKVNSSDCRYSNWSIYNTCTENGDVKSIMTLLLIITIVGMNPLVVLRWPGSTWCPLKVGHETGQLSVPGVCFRTMICNSHEALPAIENNQVLNCLFKAASIAMKPCFQR